MPLPTLKTWTTAIMDHPKAQDFDLHTKATAERTIKCFVHVGANDTEEEEAARIHNRIKTATVHLKEAAILTIATGQPNQIMLVHHMERVGLDTNPDRHTHAVELLELEDVVAPNIVDTKVLFYYKDKPAPGLDYLKTCTTQELLEAKGDGDNEPAEASIEKKIGSAVTVPPWVS